MTLLAHRRRLKAVALALMAFLALVAAPTVVAARPQGAPYGVQPLARLTANRPAVMVMINGQGPFRFLIDTATSVTVLTPATRARLGITAVPGPPAEIVTAAGAVRSHYYNVAEIGMAGVIVEGVRAVVIDLPDQLSIAGALGADILSNFIVDLDMRSQTLTLYPLNAAVAWSGLKRIQGTLNPHGFIVFPTRVSNILAHGVFDSGAQLTVGNSRLATFARSLGVTSVARNMEHNVTDAGRLRRFASSKDFDQVSIGASKWREVRVMISDMRVFDQIGLANDPAIFVGMDLMIGRRIVIDYANASLWLAP